jgi:hypothetical protein
MLPLLPEELAEVTVSASVSVSQIPVGPVAVREVKAELIGTPTEVPIDPAAVNVVVPPVSLPAPVMLPPVAVSPRIPVEVIASPRLIAFPVVIETLVPSMVPLLLKLTVLPGELIVTAPPLETF